MFRISNLRFGRLTVRTQFRIAGKTYCKASCVCPRWLDPDNGYETFCEDMGPKPSKDHSLGRWGDVGNYEKANCSWQTWEQQGLEKKTKHWNQKLEQIHNSNAAIAA
jgi:hypothetical protein